MKTDGLFTTHGYRIKHASYKEPIRLIFFGDIHRDSLNHADAEWQRFLSYAKSLKNAYFFGMGDYLDSTSSSERQCLDGSAFQMHETILHDLEALQLEKVRLIAKELAPIKDRIIGLVGGNHYFHFQDGTTSDQRICQALSCKYLGVCTLTRLYIDVAGRQVAFDIFAHHGSGGSGRLLGGSINRIDQMREYVDADIYAQGHDHKRSATPANPKIFLSHSSKTGLKIKQRQQWLLRTGSFLKAYEPGRASYNVDACRGPCSLGHVELELMPVLQAGSNHDYQFEIRGIA